MKKLINSVETILVEQLEGMIKAHSQLLVNHNPLYVKRADAPVSGKVAIISGGGSGHEPMHVGFVGKGMLDGACPGEIFTSPTPDQIFECGLNVDSGEGVLLLIKNYTGDVLNFETATELLSDSGIKVATVLIDDDVAVKDSLYTAGRRGVASTVIIEKLLGAAADKGYRLDELAILGCKLNNSGHSIGIALNACIVPAAGKPSFVLKENEMEFGVGIHGEPGIERREFTNLNKSIEQMFYTLISHGDYIRTVRHWNNESKQWDEITDEKQALKKGDRVIAMVNNLGSVPLSELYGVYNILYDLCQKFGLIIERNLVGSYCTSLDMQGISITLLKVDDDILSLWDAPVNTSALRWGE